MGVECEFLSFGKEYGLKRVFRLINQRNWFIYQLWKDYRELIYRMIFHKLFKEKLVF